MTDPTDDFSQALRDAIRDHESVPDSVREFGRAARAFVDLDAELAALVASSAEGGLAPTRASGPGRVLVFALNDAELEIELGDELVGAIDPVPDRLELVTSAGRDQIEVGEFGVFRCAVPERPFRFSAVFGGRVLATPVIMP